MDASKTGSFISQLRKEKGLTQKQLAKGLDVSDKAVSRWETGKGYPDVETLPRLAECLGVTITEILNGEKSSDIADDKTEKVIYDVCSTAIETSVKRKRKIHSLKIALVIISCMLFVSILASVFVSFFTSAMVREYNNVVGSENCIIAEDGSSLNYFGMVYLPIIVDESTGITPSDTVLVQEARVEGHGFISKLPFSETLYGVNGVENNEMVYVRSSGLAYYSRYFCREDKYDEYYQKLDVKNYVPTDCFISDFFSNSDISQEAVNYLTELKKSDKGVVLDVGTSNSDNDYQLFTYEYCPINLGSFKAYDDKIYFCPSVVFAENDESLYYQIDEEFYDYFKSLL